jgi:hypothetical protein
MSDSHTAAYHAYVQQYGEQAAQAWYNYYYGSHDGSYAASYYQQPASQPHDVASPAQGGLQTPQQQPLAQLPDKSNALSTAPFEVAGSVAGTVRQEGGCGAHSAAQALRPGRRLPQGSSLASCPCIHRRRGCGSWLGSGAGEGGLSSAREREAGGSTAQRQPGLQSRRRAKPFRGRHGRALGRCRHPPLRAVCVLTVQGKLSWRARKQWSTTWHPAAYLARICIYRVPHAGWQGAGRSGLNQGRCSITMPWYLMRTMLLHSVTARHPAARVELSLRVLPAARLWIHQSMAVRRS